MPKFSIIVPVYKVEEYLRECVDSILNQEYTDFEVILVDDGSPDNCPQICDEYAAKDSRIRVLHKENSGVSDSRNRGIEMAQGEYLWFVDSDDYIAENAFLTALKYVEQKPDVIKFARASITEKDRSTFGKDTVDFSGIFSGGKKEAVLNRANTNNILPYCWSNMYKTSFIKNNGIKFDPRLSYGEDSVFNFEAFFRAEEIMFAEEYVYVYRVRNSSVSKTAKREFDFRFADQIELNCSLRDEIYERYSKNPKKDYYNDKSRFVIFTIYLNILLTGVCRSGGNRYSLFRKVSKRKMISDALKVYDLSSFGSKGFDLYLLWAVKHRLYLLGYMFFRFLYK